MQGLLGLQHLEAARPQTVCSSQVNKARRRLSLLVGWAAASRHCLPGSGSRAGVAGGPGLRLLRAWGSGQKHGVSHGARCSRRPRRSVQGGVEPVFCPGPLDIGNGQGQTKPSTSKQASSLVKHLVTSPLRLGRGRQMMLRLRWPAGSTSPPGSGNGKLRQRGHAHRPWLSRSELVLWVQRTGTAGGLGGVAVGVLAGGQRAADVLGRERSGPGTVPLSELASV